MLELEQNFLYLISGFYTVLLVTVVAYFLEALLRGRGTE